MLNPPKTKKISVYINVMQGLVFQIFVVGEVETGASTNVQSLNRAKQTDNVGKELLLDLSIHNTGGNGSQVFQFVPVRH